MPILELSGVQLTTDKGFQLKNIGFSQLHREKLAIAGETGSGKTTLLKAAGGLIETEEGSILFEGQPIIRPQDQLIPGHPGIAFLSQHFELPNNLRVEQVLEYASQQEEEKAATFYEMCRIQHLLKRKTNELSGGEKQRIALARLLVGTPKLLMLDEPFSNLDMEHKKVLKEVLDTVGEELNITFTMVSHDPKDTLSWADQILVMRNGTIVQKTDPKEIYERPVSAYVAGLFGNFQVLSRELLEKLWNIRINKEEAILRPEHFAFVKEGKALKGKITAIHYYGGWYEAEVTLFNNNILTVRMNDEDRKIGEQVQISLKSSAKNTLVTN